jgi:peptide-methionine (S)-S-oxide reductase
MIPEPSKALKGREKPLDVDPVHAISGHSIFEPFPSQCEKILFGMGCFWGAEKLFWDIKGVYITAVGYAGGSSPNPNYEEVCSGMTGHAEVVMVVFDPNIISLKSLLVLFWENHNPTEGMKQGNDIGTQYRSAIYAYSQEQLETALESKKLYDQLLIDQHVPLTTTEIKIIEHFYYAETYHQQYLFNNPMGYCPNHSCSVSGLPEIANHI